MRSFFTLSEGAFLFLWGMKYFVYIIYSSNLDIYYKGYSESPFERLSAHNKDESRYTRNKGPWELVFLQSFLTKREALIRERSLKKYSHSQLQDLITSLKNELK